MPYGYEIITYGGSDALVLLFNGIATAVGDDHYTTMIRLFALMGLTAVLLESTFKNHFSLNVQWLFGFILLYNVLLVPKVTIHLVDRIQQNKVQAVNNVPWGLAIFASLSSEIGDSMTRLCEKMFSLPDDLRYSKTGMVMASNLVIQASRFHITDPDFAKNMREYMQQCVFYDVLLGKYTLHDLMNTSDLWTFITKAASPARAFVYVDAQRQGQIQTCLAGVKPLAADWEKEVNQASLFYNNRLFPNHPKTPFQEKVYLLSQLDSGYGYLTGISEKAADTMRQTLLMNVFEKSLMAQGATVNAPAAIHAYAVSRADEMKRSTYQITGELAARWIPLMKNVFEALFYGAFLFIFLVALLPMGIGLLRTYILSLFWLQSWAPLYAILNLIMTLDAKSQSTAMTSLSDGSHALTLSTMSGLAQVNADTAALAGYLSMSIPFIAYSLIQGGAHAFNSLASSMSSVGQSVASTAASEATTGNFSLGNTHFDTHAAHNTSANHFNTNAVMESGMASYQTESGSMIHHTPGGDDVVDNRGSTISNTATTVNVADSLRASAANHYENSLTTSQQATQGYTDSFSQGLRDLVDLSHSEGKSLSHDESSSLSQSTGMTSSMTHSADLTERFAHDHQLTVSQSAHILAQASASIGLAGMGVSGTSSADHSELFQEAKQFVRATHYAETSDNALRAVHDQHVRASSDEGQRLVNSISSSYDHANHYREEAILSLQKAESYRAAMNLSNEQAHSINQVGTQALVRWMSQQPLPGETSGHMGIQKAADMLNHDLASAKHYADEFMSQEGDRLFQKISGEINPTSMMSAHEKESQAFREEGAQELQIQQGHSTTMLQNQAQHAADSPIPSSVASPLSQPIRGVDQTLSQGRKILEQEGHSLQETVQKKTQDDQHDLMSTAASNALKTMVHILKD